MKRRLKAVLLASIITAITALFCRSLCPQEDSQSITKKELSKIFKTFKSGSFEERWNAAQIVLDLDKASLPALRKRLLREHKASGESMKRILYSLRKKLKEAKIKEFEAKGKSVKLSEIPVEKPLKFLKILIEKKRDDNIIAWRSAAEIMTLLVALTSMQTKESILTVLDFSTAHDAAFRKEIYQLMLWTGEKALPAMILRKQSKDENIQIVMNAYLNKMNLARPGQQVQVKDPSVLAELLTLFSETKDFETIDAIAPFLNAENPIVRTAARQSIMAFGKSSLWVLRKEYENYAGEKPDPSWSAEKVAEELFKAQDHDRLAPLNEKIEEGLRLAKEKKFDEMEKRFREILALQPMYERKSEMVPGYMEAARHYMDKKNYDKASFLLRIARRINSDPEKNDKIMAAFYYVEALRSLDDGIADPELMKKAVELDPEFDEAKSKLKEIKKIYRGRKIKGYRILAAGGIGTTALLILILIILKKW